MTNKKLDGRIAKHYDSTVIEESYETYDGKEVRCREYLIDVTTEHDLDLIEKWFQKNGFGTYVMVEDYSDTYIGYVGVNIDDVEDTVSESKEWFNKKYKEMKKELK